MCRNSDSLEGMEVKPEEKQIYGSQIILNGSWFMG